METHLQTQSSWRTCDNMLPMKDRVVWDVYMGKPTEENSRPPSLPLSLPIPTFPFLPLLFQLLPPISQGSLLVELCVTIFYNSDWRACCLHMQPDEICSRISVNTSFL